MCSFFASKNHLSTDSNKRLFGVVAALWLLTVQGCSSAIDEQGYSYDPWAPLNRKVFAFNEGLDTVLVKPVAGAYDALVPSPVQRGVSHFFANIDDMGSVVNSVLQLKWDQAARMTGRVISNTVYGLGGLFDVGTAMGLERMRADFSSTLAHYGVASGPYMVLPVLGPSTPRDAFGLLVDTVVVDPLDFVSRDEIVWEAFALNGLSRRAQLLDAERSMADVIDDKYLFVRDSWLQYRWGQLNEGGRSSAQQQAIDDVFMIEQ